MSITRPFRCALLLAAFPMASAVPQAVTTLEGARQQIEDLSIDSALAGLRSVLDQRQRLSPQQLVRAYVLLGIAEASRGQEDAAQAAFHEALWLDPDLRVDTLGHLSSALPRVFGGERARWSSILGVTSDPAGAQVTAGGRTIGRAPLQRRIPGDASLTLSATTDAGEQTVTVLVPVRTAVTVHLPVPEDTLPWPVLPTYEDLRTAFRVRSASEWRPTSSLPVAVPPPSQEPERGPVTITGAVTALVGVAAIVGGAIAKGSAKNESDQERAVAVATIGFLAAGVGGGIALVGRSRDEQTWIRAKGRYALYEVEFERWHARMEVERSEWVNSRSRAALTEAEAATEPERRRIIEHNAVVRARNAALPPPRVTVERMPGR